MKNFLIDLGLHLYLLMSFIAEFICIMITLSTFFINEEIASNHSFLMFLSFGVASILGFHVCNHAVELFVKRFHWGIK